MPGCCDAGQRTLLNNRLFWIIDDIRILLIGWASPLQIKFITVDILFFKLKADQEINILKFTYTASNSKAYLPNTQYGLRFSLCKFIFDV